MKQNRIGRRQLVRTAAAVAAGGALVGGTGVAAASANEGSSGHRILGAWWVTHTDNPPGDPTPAITVVGFAAGGVLTASDIRPAGGTGTGTWTATGSHFRASYWAAVPLGPPDTPGGSINIRVRGSVHGDRVSGTYAYTLFDPSGAELLAGTGTFTGRRLTA
jgi:hypothetical protein